MTTNIPLILFFDNIRATDLPLVGGKGANLGEMTHAGFPIPPGFCLTTIAFQQFMDACANTENLYNLLDSVTTEDIEIVRRVGEKVRNLLLEVPMPHDVANTVRQSLQAIGPEHAYAVRSSATAEDLPDTSFAGQQDTYLNIIGETAMLDAIRRCWVSLFTDRAILYRAQNKFDHRDVRLSVVIQRMIMSEKSGILFTADPLTGHRHTLTIDASFGLGEALVSGLVSPDAYRVDKRNFTVLDCHIAEKKVAIYPDLNGGTRQETLKDPYRTQQVLSNYQLIELARMAAKVEDHYGSPQDIEWSFADDTFYLLQARPITSLYPIDGLQSPDDSLHVFFSMGHQQNMTRAMAPLSLSTFPNLIPLALRSDGEKISFLRFSGGRLFIDITQALRHPVLKRIIPLALSQFDVLVPQLFKLATQRPEFKRPHGLHFSPGFFKGLMVVLRRLFNGLWRRNLTGFVTQTNDLMDEFITMVDHNLRAYPQGKEQIQALLNELPEMAPFFLNWVFEAAGGIAATRVLPKLSGRWLSADKVEALTLGVPGNVVNEMNLMLSDLAEVAHKNPQLSEAFQHLGDNAHQWLAKAAEIEGSELFFQSWYEFLARYGARGPSEIDMSMNRWHEDPLPVLRVIAANIEKNMSSRALFNAQIKAREAAFAELLAASGRGLLGGLRHRLFKRLNHVLVEAGGMREHHKFMAVRFFGVIKSILKENAAVLVQNGKFAAPDDIWYLTWPELLTIWDDNETSYHEIIAQRKADQARYLKLKPPVVITSDGEIPVANFHNADAPEGALLGNPVSPGVIEGMVHIIRDPQSESLAPDEILVTEFTDPGWTPLFINAGGLIMEIGGALAHGSVVAREYGIPAVVGVQKATTKLQTGQRVRVDGNRGIIEIL